MLRKCSPPPGKTQDTTILKKCSSPLCVKCHMTHIIFRMSPVTCTQFVGGGKAKLGASSGLRVCHPLGTPRLVLIRTTIVVFCNSIDSVENLESATYFIFSKISNFYSFEICTFIIHTFAITPICSSTLILASYHLISESLCSQFVAVV